jgi:hypothetical protein
MLVEALEFLLGVEDGKYTFSTDNWDEGCVSGSQEWILDWKKKYPLTKVFFEVEDESSATIVLRMPKGTKWFWISFNEFLEEWGPGDKITAVESLLTIDLQVWYD